MFFWVVEPSNIGIMEKRKWKLLYYNGICIGVILGYIK